MASDTDGTFETLKAARLARGLSQRDLGALAGVPQAHISKIEAGAVDLRVSSLVSIARVLDLELALVPRKAVPAVQSVVRQLEDGTRPSSSPPPGKALRRIGQTLESLPDAAHAPVGRMRLQRLVRELQRLPLQDRHGNALKRIEQALRTNPGDDAVVSRALAALQALRSEFAHDGVPAQAGPARPAYALDFEDGDA